MNPEYTKNLNIRARCPDCDGALTTFERKDTSSEYGFVLIDTKHSIGDKDFGRIIYRLFRCAGCGRGGLGELHDNGNEGEAVLESFFPISINQARIPTTVPLGIVAELREAELCASVGASRAASALLRSVLEKTLKANGYATGELERSNLLQKIDAAATDGIITEARQKKAHSDIRVLGNDVLHDEWREVKTEEVEAAHRYVQRILEDFYDDRSTVEAILIQKKRLSTNAATVEEETSSTTEKLD